MKSRGLFACYERLLLAGAILLLAGTSAWSWCQRSAIGMLRREPVAMKLVGGEYLNPDEPAPAREPAAWSAPRSQTAGAGWRYEVFTPPAVFYDAATKTFAVTSASTEQRKDPARELELVEIRRQPFPLQLVGCIGKPGEYVAVLSSPGRSETLLVRAGDRLDSLGVRLTTVEMTKVLRPDADEKSGWEWTPRAVLRDVRTDEEITLSSGSELFTDKLTALFRRTSDGADSKLEADEGGTLRAGAATYRVVSLQLHPPIARLERLADGVTVDELVLTPRGNPVEGKELPLTTETAGRVVTVEAPR